MRGSFSSSTASASTARTVSFTRRIRSVIEAHHLPLASHEDVLLAVEIARRLVQQAPDLPALAQVVEAVEQDAALEALDHLARVLLEALELRDRRLLDHGAVADHTDTGVPADDAVRHHAAGDRAEPRDAEELPHLGLADRLL